MLKLNFSGFKKCKIFAPKKTPIHIVKPLYKGGKGQSRTQERESLHSQTQKLKRELSFKTQYFDH